MNATDNGSLLTVKPSQLRTLLTKAIPKRAPVLITGAPGIGKTDIAKKVCADLGAECMVMHPVVSDPTDFKGMPWVVNGKAIFLPFGDLDRLIGATVPTVCFLDDLGQAPASVQAAAMQLVRARHVNGHAISDNVVFLAATNRRTDRAAVSGLIEPLKSRMVTIVELVAHLPDWNAWAVSPDGKIAPQIRAFLHFRPKLLSDFQPSADLTNSPSPRTWEHVNALLDMDLPAEMQFPAFAGAIGEAAATEFLAFLRIWAQMVSPQLVFTNPDSAGIPSDPSAMYALATALADLVNHTSMNAYARYLTRLASAGKEEFAAVSIKSATARDATLSNTPGYINLMSGPVGHVFTGDAS